MKPTKPVKPQRCPDHLQSKLTERRPRPKGYGDSLNIGWSHFKIQAKAGHRAFFESRGMEVPPSEDFNFGAYDTTQKKKKPCRSDPKTGTDTPPTGSSEATLSGSSEPRAGANGAPPSTENPTQSPEAT